MLKTVWKSAAMRAGFGSNRANISTMGCRNEDQCHSHQPVEHIADRQTTAGEAGATALKQRIDCAPDIRAE
jgi:hypothetical protein